MAHCVVLGLCLALFIIVKSAFLFAYENGFTKKSEFPCRIVILTDEHTPFDPELGIELFRVEMDTDRLGRYRVFSTLLSLMPPHTPLALQLTQFPY